MITIVLKSMRISIRRTKLGSGQIPHAHTAGAQVEAVATQGSQGSKKVRLLVHN